MFFGKYRSGSLLILKWHSGVGNFVLRFKTEFFMKLQLKDILLGVATAATQIEGDDRNNSWYDWAEGEMFPTDRLPYWQISITVYTGRI